MKQRNAQVPRQAHTMRPYRCPASMHTICAAMLRPVMFMLLVLILMAPIAAAAATAKKVQPINLEQLRRVFNAGTGKTRIVVLLSPT